MSTTPQYMPADFTVLERRARVSRIGSDNFAGDRTGQLSRG
jgi:hypothetical protein